MNDSPNLKQFRVGLALEGGGAKGAYAIGCLTALEEAGIQFDAVAGTSVGALNAAIVSTGKLAFGKRFWSTLTYERVCYPKTHLPFWVLLPLQIVGLVFHNFPTKSGSMPFSSRLPPLLGLKWVALVIGLHVAFVIVSMFMLRIIIGGRSSADWIFVGGTVFLVLVGLVWTIPFIVRAAGWSAFDVTPLEETIRLELANVSYAIPTYATLGAKAMVFDPDRPEFLHAGVSVRTYSRRAVEGEQDTPTYVRVDKLNSQKRQMVLVGSAALPFGVFPPVIIDGQEFIDGGLADNAPIYPLIEFEHCDCIVVIRLRPADKQFPVKYWQEVDRNLRITTIATEDCRAMYLSAMTSRRSIDSVDERIDPPVNVPYRDFPESVKHIFIIAPEKPLGNFLSGTMNFRAAYAARIMKQGYQDTLRGLSSFAREIQSSDRAPIIVHSARGLKHSYKTS